MISQKYANRVIFENREVPLTERSTPPHVLFSLGDQQASFEILREASLSSELVEAIELAKQVFPETEPEPELVVAGETDEAQALLAKIPETAEVRRVLAMARTGLSDASALDVEGELTSLLDRVKDDDDARQRYVDLLAVLGPDDPRTADYRRKLTTRLF